MKSIKTAYGTLNILNDYSYLNNYYECKYPKKFFDTVLKYGSKKVFDAVLSVVDMDKVAEMIANDFDYDEKRNMFTSFMATCSDEDYDPFDVYRSASDCLLSYNKSDRKLYNENLEKVIKILEKEE